MDEQRTLQRVDSVYRDSIDGVSIRLLRFSQPEDDVFVGELETFRLADAPHFFTASYVWGKKVYSDLTIELSTGPMLVLASLAPFLRMVSHSDDFKDADWWWIDSLCINLEDGLEREKQVQIMAEIYKRARRAILWLGEEKEEDSDCTGAIEFLHRLAKSKIVTNGSAFHRDDSDINGKDKSPEFVSNCLAVSNLLFRPWWTRVWTLQEFILPKEAKLYCGYGCISRGKFKSAIYAIFLLSSNCDGIENEIVPRTAFYGAFNRRRIHQWHATHTKRGISLVSILAYLGNHSATDSRDRLFSVLGLITARDRSVVGQPEYASSVEVLFSRLVRSFWLEYGNLDIICFVHLFSRYAASVDPGQEDAMPCWAPDWRAMIDYASPVPLMASQGANEHIGNFRPLRSTIWTAAYAAPGPELGKDASVEFSDDLKELWCDGVILDAITALGGLDARELRCQSFVCAAEGHDMLQSEDTNPQPLQATLSPMQWIGIIARSLVLDRLDKYLCYQAPETYAKDFIRLCHNYVTGDPVDWSFASWFDLNRQLRFGNMMLEDLIKSIPVEATTAPPPLRRPPSHPNAQFNEFDDKMDTFLSRFHDTVRKKARRLMVTQEGLVGAAPCRARVGDVVAVLFGCSIPLVLRNQGDPEAWQVIGEGYAHHFMNGEAATLLEEGKRKRHRFRLI